MTIRVTVGSASAGALSGLQAASARYAALQEKMSTGDQIGRPSDDPAGTVRALALRGDLKQNAQYTRNSSDATAWLSVADTTYGQITDLVQKVRTLTVQASNTGASTGESAKAIAEQIESIRGAILKLSNTTYNDRPVFGGTTAGGVAFEENAGAVIYKGDTGKVTRAIGNKNDVTISQTGSTAFGADGSNVFDLMDKLVTDLTGPGAAPSSTALKDIDAAMQGLTSQRAASGAALARVQSAQSTQATDKITLKTNLSEIQDIDLAEVAIQLNTSQVVYQAALQTTANIKQLSLLNFLK